jgi:hypothetical protein
MRRFESSRPSQAFVRFARLPRRRENRPEIPAFRAFDFRLGTVGSAISRRKSLKVSGHVREYSRFAETIGGDRFDQDCRPTIALCLDRLSYPHHLGKGPLARPVASNRRDTSSGSEPESASGKTKRLASARAKIPIHDPLTLRIDRRTVHDCHETLKAANIVRRDVNRIRG